MLSAGVRLDPGGLRFQIVFFLKNSHQCAVSHTKHAGGAVSDGKSIALHGVFGYASVDDHIRWRETPEHAKVLEDMAQSPLFKLGLRNPRIPGGNIFVPDSSMFHVRFRGGCRKR